MAQITSTPDFQHSEINTQSQTALKSKPQIENIPVVLTTPGQQSKSKLLKKEVPPYPDPIKRSHETA